MKFSAAILTAVLSASALVSAGPVTRRAAKITALTDTTRLDAAGAIYCECGFVCSYVYAGYSHC